MSERNQRDNPVPPVIASRQPFSSVSGPADLAREVQAYFARDPDIFGGADILALDVLTPRRRAAIIVTALTGISDGQGRAAVGRYVLVLPPGSDSERAMTAIHEDVAVCFPLMAGRDMTPQERTFITGRIGVVAAADRRCRSVLDILEIQPEATAVIVTEAAAYRDAATPAFVAVGASTPLLPEDVWAPHLHALARDVADVARCRNIYVALDANELFPTRTEMKDLLESIDNCGVMGSVSRDDPASILAVQVDRWDGLLRDGRVGRVLQEVEELPASLDGNKAYLRIQMLHKAGLMPQALEAIEAELALGRDMDANSRSRLARIAQDANAPKTAVRVLEPAAGRIDSLEYLEQALTTATDAGADDLAARFRERLEERHPDSATLRRHHRQALLESRDYAAIAELAQRDGSDEDDIAFYKALAQHLDGPGVPDYGALIASAPSDVDRADVYRTAAAHDAVGRRLPVHALQLVLPLPRNPNLALKARAILLRAIEAIFLLAGPDGSLPVPMEHLQVATLALVEGLAGDPLDYATRVNLAQALQPSIAGATGLAMMAAIVLELTARGIRLHPRRKKGSAHLPWLIERKFFLTAAFEWMKSEEPVVIGRGVLPVELLTEPADEVVSALVEFLDIAPHRSEEDLKTLHLWLALATAITPYGSDPDLDLQIMRLVAGRLATNGRAQAGRDLAEQAMLCAGAAPRRRRLAWFAMADVYHRCHNHIEGLIAMACTLAADEGADEDQVWHELTGIARLLRDCGLSSYASQTVAAARRLLVRMNLGAGHSHRLDTLELQIQQSEPAEAGEEKQRVEAMLVDAVANGEAVLRANDATAPIATLLGQLVRGAEILGATIPPDAGRVFTELRARADRNAGPLIDAMSSSRPSAPDLLELLTSAAAARYSDDVGYDMRNVSVVAGRALADDGFISDVHDASFALEALADRGVAVPGWETTAQPPPGPASLREPGETARTISLAGVSVVQAGFDAEGRLVRVDAVAGELAPAYREPSELILEDRFKTWAGTYPFRYGIDETTMNLFHNSTADLRMSNLPKGPVVIVADVEFQPFPPNLIQLDDGFAGRTRPMAAAPSLAWLQAARACPAPGDGSFRAWIPTGVGCAESPTMTMIAERLGPTFETHGFILDEGATLPSVFAGASMAVIAAHGGVHPDGRYFQVVSDEDSLKVSAADMAGALRNVEVVILFVCSGGRADRHPTANTSVGLAKQILDRGCSAVVASPWPLDSTVPSHWLPAFLGAWSSGESLIVANHVANRHVDARYAMDPARGLAMSVFGDPLLRKT